MSALTTATGAKTAETPSIDTRLRPFEALRAVRRLFADPQDTRQVFVVLAALRGRSGARMFARFAKSAVGLAVLADRRRLIDRLEDHAGLARLPDGSLGREYLTFMQAENLSAAGLIEPSMTDDAAALPPDARLFRDRMRDMHDLTHVVTGYGRDGFGELCLLAFMFAQSKNLGQAFICFMGWARFGREGGRGRLAAALLEAWRHGRKASWLPEQEWEAILSMPLPDLRARLQVAKPTRYPAAWA